MKVAQRFFDCFVDQAETFDNKSNYTGVLSKKGVQFLVIECIKILVTILQDASIRCLDAYARVSSVPHQKHANLAQLFSVSKNDIKEEDLLVYEMGELKKLQKP